MQILDNGIEFNNGDIQYLWFKITDDGGKQRCRAVAFRELTSLALDKQEPEDWNMVGKQQAALRGLYSARVDFVYSAMGIFKPRRVGIIQYYGAAGDGNTVTEAGDQALEGLTAVVSSLSNFQQSQTRSPQKRWIEWYLEFITQRAQKLSAVLGHPDPRDNRSLRELDGGLPFDDGDLAAEQTAGLFRGMAKVGKDFVFQVTAQQIRREWLTEKYMAISRRVSDVASRQRGALSIGASISIPIMAALSNSLGQSEGAARSEAQSVAEGDNHSWGRGESDGHAVTESESHTVGGSETHTVSSSRTESHGVSDGVSHGVSDSESHSVSRGQTDTVSSSDTKTTGQSHTHTEGVSAGQSQGVSASQSQGVSESQTSGVSSSQSQSQGQSTSEMQSQSSAQGDTVGGSLQASPLGLGVQGNYGHSWNAGESASQGASQSQGAAQSQGQSQSASQGVSAGQSQGVSAGQSQGQSSSDSWSSSSSQSHTEGQSHSESRGETHGNTHTESRGESHTVSHGVATSRGESHSYSKMWAHTKGHAETESHQESRQEGWGESHTEGQARGVGYSQGGMSALTRGLSTGMVPGINIGRSWQTVDAVAENLTAALNQLRSHFNLLSRNGGFLGEVVLFTEDDAGATAGDTLIPQAFHGPNSPTPVLTIRDDSLNPTLRQHAATFLVHDETDPNDPLMGVLGKRFSTYLTAAQLAAYTAPAIFQEGTMRAIPAIPRDGMAFYPEMDGDVLLGHQFSPETADLTNTPVMLAKDRFVHMMFAGETGYGKTVGAERLVYEVVRKWPHTRVVVLDFGAGWRKLLKAAGIQDRVDIRQLTPDGVRPLRWNPMQISRYITPEVQAASFVDIFGNLSQLGVKQQKHRFYELVEEVYLKHGVLVNDPKVLNDGHWGSVVDATEARLSGGQIGQSLRQLDPSQAQTIAVYRSRHVSLQMLFDATVQRIESLSSRDQVGQNIYNGIKSRLGALIRGATAAQFAAGEDAIDIAELGSGEKSLLILEGGKHLDQFSKAWLLGWAGWLLYEDMVQRHERQVDDTELLMVFEEANIIFTGMDKSDENNPGGVTVAQQYSDMFRDSRKYGVHFAVITQSPSLIPAGVRSSCGSMFINYLANPDDKDIALSAISKSEKGFRDEAWRRFLSDLGKGMTIARLPYSFERTEMRPFLFRPLILNVKPPKDTYIAQRLGRIDLRG